MPYATQADLVPLRMSHKDLLQLTEDGTNEVGTAVVTQALEEASGKVDAYCGARYQTPLQLSDVVKACTLDIAVYLLFTRKRDSKKNDVVRDRYTDAIKFLEGVAAGRIQLDQPVSAPAQSVGTGVTRSTRESVFSNCNLNGFD